MRLIDSVFPFLLATSLVGAPLNAQCPEGTPPPCRAVRALAGATVASIAVLNFENRSRDTSDAFLAEGLPDEISARLGRVGRITVIARSQVRRLHGSSALAIPELGRALSAANLVSGSVHGTPTHLRVSVELTRAANAVQVWSNIYDRSRADLLDIQADIATQIAIAIAGTLRPGERTTLAQRPARDPRALEHIMRGNLLVLQRSTRNLSRAITEYQAAVTADSTSAEAYARLSFTYAVCVVWNYRCGGLPSPVLVERAAIAAATALKIDSTTSSAWLALGEVQLARGGDPVNIFHAYRRATQLDSSNAEAWHLHGFALSRANRDSAARAAYRHALRLDPGRANTYELLARLSVAERKLDEAVALLDTAIALEPQLPLAYVLLANIHAYRGDTAATRKDAEAYLRTETTESWDGFGVPVMAFAFASAGDSIKATSAVNELLADSTRWGGRLWNAMWRLGRVEEYWRVASLADGTVRDRPSWFNSRFPWYDPIREDARMQRIIDIDRKRWQRVP